MEPLNDLWRAYEEILVREPEETVLGQLQHFADRKEALVTLDNILLKSAYPEEEASRRPKFTPKPPLDPLDQALALTTFQLTLTRARLELQREMRGYITRLSSSPMIGIRDEFDAAVLLMRWFPELAMDKDLARGYSFCVNEFRSRASSALHELFNPLTPIEISLSVEEIVWRDPYLRSVVVGEEEEVSQSAAAALKTSIGPSEILGKDWWTVEKVPYVEDRVAIVSMGRGVYQRLLQQIYGY